MRVVADTSALVSLGTVANHAWNPLDYLLKEHRMLVPKLVVEELRETAAYDDPSGRGAKRVMDRHDRFETLAVDLDETFPLEDGENAAVTLANERDAGQFLCDEFTRLALIHASLVDTRLVTTPTLLVGLARADAVDPGTAESLLKEIRTARSWSSNAYVARAETVLRGL
jgi:predicted nucleic acid-binding protein